MELTGCSVDLVRGRVHRGDDALGLTTREADLLRYLVANASRAVSRDELLAQVWGYADTVVSRACDNTIRRLREKIEADPTRPDHLLTVHGAGYLFEPGRLGTESVPPPTLAWVELGRVRVSLATRRVSGPDGEEPLTEAEAAVLGALMEASGAVVTRERLTRAGWGRTRGPLVHAIFQLRQKLGGPDTIATSRGGGYRLTLSTEAASRSTLLGREDLVRQGRWLLATADWLLIVGPPGAGKSRLARELCGDALWVDLGAVTDPSVAAGQVARALGSEPGLGDPLELVARVLARRGGLLVLDDLDGLSASSAHLIERWRGPGVTLVGTARVRSGAAREALLEVGPLPRPDAIALFLARARAVSAAFRADPADPEAVGEIVDQVDRMPLAIELLAARTSVLGLTDLRKRVRTELAIRPPGGDPRHHSIEALVRASLEGLPPRAYDALLRILPFRSGLFVDDAEAVLGPDAVDLLQILRDHSLLHRLADLAGEARFDTWQSVRHVLGRTPDPEADRRYCERMARWGEDPARVETLGNEHELRRVHDQLEEFVHAATVALGLGEPDRAARCAIPAIAVHLGAGPVEAGLALAEQVVAGGPSPELAVVLRLQQAALLGALGRAEEQFEALNAAIGIARAADRVEDEARARTVLGHRQLYLRHPGAEASLVEALRRWSEAPDSLRSAGWRGYAEADLHAVRGEDEAARIAARRALRAARAAGDRPLSMRLQTWLVNEALLDGRLGEAATAGEAELSLAPFDGLRFNALVHLLDVAMAGDDGAAMDRWLPELEALRERLSTPLYDVWVLRVRAVAHSVQGRWEEARRVLALAEAAVVPGSGMSREEVELLGLQTEFAIRVGDGEAASRMARENIARASEVDRPRSVAVAQQNLGLALLCCGDAPGSRAVLDAADEVPRVHRAYRLAWEAVLAATEGDAAATRSALEELRAEVLRSGRPIADDDRARVAALIGSWAAERLGARFR